MSRETLDEGSVLDTLDILARAFEHPAARKTWTSEEVAKVIRNSAAALREGTE